MTKNNNKRILFTLARRSYRSNKARNRLMILSIAITVILICCICTLMKGKTDAQYLMEVRHSGSNAATTLEYPSAAQISRINHLYYVRDSGQVKYFADGGKTDTSSFACVVTSRRTYEHIYRPAYSGICGRFPAKKNEVFISIRGLDEMKIKDPKVGMTLKLQIKTDKAHLKDQKFTLCGYYTDYVHPVEGPAIAFFSEDYLHDMKLSMDQPTELLIRQNDLFTGEQIERMLYRDIPMRDKAQTFHSEDSANINVIRRSIGGYDIAAVSILLLALCVFFLHYNIMNLSITRDMQHYGYLKTVGATNRQIRGMVYRQILFMNLVGTAFGSVVSMALIRWLLPGLLSRQYLNNYGVASGIIRPDPVILLIGVTGAVLLSFLSTILPAVKAGKVSPIAALRYEDNIQSTRHSESRMDTGRRFSGNPSDQNRLQPDQNEQEHADSKHADSKHANQKNDSHRRNRTHPVYPALRNLTRNRRNTILTLASLFLGFIIALASVLITTGLDITNNFKALPDFTFSVMNFPMEPGYNSHDMPLTESDVGYFRSLKGVKKVDVTYGDSVLLDPDADIWNTFFTGNMFFKNGKDREKYDEEAITQARKHFFGTVLDVGDSYIARLKTYIRHHPADIDLSGLISGNSAISISGYVFSKQMLHESEQQRGQSFQISSVEGKALGTMTFGGYADKSKDGFPDDKLDYTLNAPNFIVTEAAFQKLHLVKRPLHVEIQTSDNMEPYVHRQLQRFISDKKSALKPSEYGKLPRLSANSDGLKAAKDEIRTMRIVMYTISTMLILLGLFNYSNTTVSSLIARKKELSVMESVGMTRKQLRTLLVTEGMCYSGIVSLLLLAVGSPLLYGLFALIHHRVGYAVFRFPMLPMAMIILFLFVICILIPIYTYRKMEKESIVERLRRDE